MILRPDYPFHKYEIVEILDGRCCLSTREDERIIHGDDITRKQHFDSYSYQCKIPIDGKKITLCSIDANINETGTPIKPSACNWQNLASFSQQAS